MKVMNLILKRIFDFVSSLLGILLLSPLFLFIAIAIKATSKGPVIFKQRRLGKKGKEFYIYKFRTMVPDAEYIGEGLRVSSEKDPRITRVGRFLRSTSLDELPQLFNVLEGTMSLVGPRPPVTYHPYNGLEGYPDWARQRFEMRPGITGLAQVQVRNSATWDHRIQIDNEYVEKFTFLLDMKILFKTFYKVSSKKGIY